MILFYQEPVFPCAKAIGLGVGMAIVERGDDATEFG
jgi:hypothetical protein